MLVEFINKTDRFAYSHLTPDKLREHLRYAVATAQTMARINDETHQINALATWNVIHDKQVVFLSGIIGDRAFLQYMLQAWRTTHPHYDLMYFRKGKPVRRKHNAILTHN